ncbi:MAG TPA: bifunctional (p)ppGpp synthetase/guanosine-3',5'-bis(diphosphate) 3'-pyrophosphohydrolase [Anaerolineae bacterium]|nr:bifunctional (p)ppGpp synthetase/guanosine-3',5'-bis(diphosphate) 3'-pyrophosphohydrolase [Anaerolineae bacterium]
MPVSADERLFRAVAFAEQAHRGQFRKGTRIPYLIHPLRVAEILLRAGVAPDLAVAALLHDTLEDTAITEAALRRAFGDRVADLVVALSEPEHRTAPWARRKAHTVAFLRTAPREVVLLSLADKLDNLRSMAEDLRWVGEALWQRFNAPRAQQEAYYRQLAAVFRQRLLADPGRRLAAEFATLVDEVFA